VNADGDFSFPATLEAYPKDNSAPPIATSFSAAATDLGIQLSWSTPAEPTALAPYDVVIQWSTSSCPTNLSMGQQLVRQPSTITTILHSSATPEQTYFYSIFTVDSFNNVTTSDVLCRQATALSINSLPQLINLQALPVDGEVQFSWDLFDDADNELRVYFQHNVQPDVALDDESMTVFYTSSTETNFTHPDLTNGETQNYWIYIENTITNERTPITKLSLTPYDNLPPLQLQNVSATPSKQSILLQWNEDNLTDARQVIISMSSTSAPQKSSSGRQIYNQEPGRSTTVNVEDLMEDTQYYFSFFTLDAQNNESAPVTLYTKTKDTNPPSRPGGLIAYPADNRILLQWNESIDDDINTVQIIRNENPDLTLEDDAIFDLNGQLESFSDTTVTNNVDYNYAVYFIDESGLKSEAAIVSATPIDTIAPPKVINVTSGETDFTVDLQWQNPIVTDASQIIIRYQSGNIPNPSPFGETNSIELLPPLPESYQITDLNNDQVYAFSIFTLDSSSNFEGFESILATPSTTAPSPPATDFNATGEDSLVRLTWENPPSNYTGINIYRSTDSYADALTSAIRITAEPLPVGQTSYVDTGLPNGITYYYALVNTGDNDPSTPAQASAIPVDQTEPFPITSLTAVPSDRQIQFNWVDPSDADLSHILIRRGELDFPLSILDGTLVDEVPNGIQTVTDTDLENGDIYFYAFFAIDTNGYASQRVTLALAAKDTIPPAPVTGASVSHDNGQVTLNWTNPTDADLSRIVIRRSDSAFPVSATTGFSVASLDDGGGTIPTTYTDSGLTNDEDYFYSLFALDENNNASTAVTLTGLPADVEAPPSIYSLTVTELDGQIDFSWQTPLSVDFDRVVLLRRNDIYPVSFDDGSAQLIYDGTGTNVSDSSSITNGIDYYYRFFTLDTYNNASVLDVLTGPQDLTPPGLPACIICTYGDTSISLTWTDPTDTDLLRIHVRRSTLSPPATIDDGTPFVAVLPGVQSFSDSGLTNGTPYFYALFSEDTSGNISPPYAVTPLTPADEIPTAAPHTGAVASNEGSVTLNWLNPTDDDFTKVVIRKDPTSYPTTLDEGTLVTELTLGETTYTDLGVTDGEDYYYSLFALDEIPNTSAPLNLFGQPRDITAPPPVTGQSATGLDARIDLTWVNPIHPDFDRVLVLRKQGSFPSDPTDATAVVIYEGALQSVNDLDSLTNFTAYNYRIFSLDVFDNYSSSDVVGTPIDLTPPGLVTCTSCTPGDEQAILTWTNPTDLDLAAIRIRRSDSGYPTSSAIGDVVADLLLGETTHTDSGLTNLTPYYYSIFTEDDSGNTSAAYQVPTITPIDNTLPAAVSTLTTTSVNQQITLQWNNPGDDTVEVHIYRDTVTYPATTSDGTLISSVIISGVNDSYTDSTVITDTPYFYSVFSEDEASNFSAPATLTATPLDQTPPANVSSFSATKGDYEIDLSWVNPLTADFNQIKIYRITGASAPPVSDTYLIATLSSGEVSYTDTGLNAYTQYHYRITAGDNLGNFTTGVTASAYTDYALIADATINLTIEKDTKTFIQWAPSTHSHYDHVEIYRDTTAAPTTPGTGTLVYNGTATTVIDSGLTNGTPYHYSIFSFEDDGDYTPGTQLTLTPLNSGGLEYEGPINFGGNGPGEASALEHYYQGGAPAIRLLVGAQNNATASYSALTSIDYDGNQYSTRHYELGSTPQAINDIAYNGYWFAAGSKYDSTNTNDDFALWKIYSSLSGLYSSMTFDTGSASFNDEATNTSYYGGWYYSSGYRDISGTRYPVVWRSDYYTDLQISFSSGSWTIPTTAAEGYVVDHIHTSSGHYLFAIETTFGNDSVVMASLSNTTGTLNTGFDTDGELEILDDEITALSRSQTGETLVPFPIYASTVTAGGDTNIYAIESDGSLNAGFGTAGIASLTSGLGDLRIEDMVVETDGTLHVIGSLDDTTDLDIMYWRIATDGTVDVSTRFTNGTLGTVTYDEQWPDRILLDQFSGQVIFSATGFDGTSGYEILFGRISND
jgi:hypothetical protein